MKLDQLQACLRPLYESALSAVDSKKAVHGFLRRRGDQLQAGPRRYALSCFRKVFTVGVGKAGVPMAQAVEEILGDRLEGGFVVVKHGHGGPLDKIRIWESGHPEPDQAGLQGAEELLRFLRENVQTKDLLLVLLSGGGSALLPSPAAGITFEAKKQTTTVLLKCGADIHEINTLRKHLSRIKGGRLLEYAQDATLVGMILSDVVGDDPTSIASGPTAADPTTFADCLGIVEKYGIQRELPRAVWDYLRAGHEKRVTETPKPGDQRFDRVQNAVIGSNILALQAAAEKSTSLELAPLVLSSSIYGNTADVARVHVALAQEVLHSGNPVRTPCCLISGGETTLKVEGSGKGGRNMEFVLWCAREIRHWDRRLPVLFASLGSDGTDGPTDAAGAVATPLTIARAAEKQLSIRDHLARNDSYHFFSALGDLILTGPTQTNVMDLRFVLIG